MQHNTLCVHRSTGMWAAGWSPACVKCAAASPLESEGRFDNETFIGMVDVLKHNPDTITEHQCSSRNGGGDFLVAGK